MPTAIEMSQGQNEIILEARNHLADFSVDLENAANVYDQFFAVLRADPAFSWSIADNPHAFSKIAQDTEIKKALEDKLKDQVKDSLTEFLREEEHRNMRSWEELERHYIEHHPQYLQKLQEYPEMLSELRQLFDGFKLEHEEEIRNIRSNIQAFAKEEEHHTLHTWEEFLAHYLEDHPEHAHELDHHPELMNALKAEFARVQSEHAADTTLILREDQIEEPEEVVHIQQSSKEIPADVAELTTAQEVEDDSLQVKNTPDVYLQDLAQAVEEIPQAEQVLYPIETAEQTDVENADELILEDRDEETEVAAEPITPAQLELFLDEIPAEQPLPDITPTTEMNTGEHILAENETVIADPVIAIDQPAQEIDPIEDSSSSEISPAAPLPTPLETMLTVELILADQKKNTETVANYLQAALEQVLPVVPIDTKLAQNITLLLQAIETQPALFSTEQLPAILQLLQQLPTKDKVAYQHLIALIETILLKKRYAHQSISLRSVLTDFYHSIKNILRSKSKIEIRIDIHLLDFYVPCPIRMLLFLLKNAMHCQAQRKTGMIVLSAKYRKMSLTRTKMQLTYATGLTAKKYYRAYHCSLLSDNATSSEFVQ